MTLEAYCRQFSALRRAPNFPDISRKKAPHKPLLLLAVMEMIGRGEITSRLISITGELTELNALFTEYWRAIMPPAQTSSIAFPFSRLNSEPFWELVPRPSKQITMEVINSITAVTQLRHWVLGANLDEELFLLLANPETRLILRYAHLQASFSIEGRRILLDEIGFEHHAYEYSLTLAKQAHQIKEIEVPPAYEPAVRDQGFRKAVVRAYDHRCALCGVRIVTPEGRTVVEAAHIKPWNLFHDDAVVNGMALCRLCHWAFDEGLMGVDEQNAVITSRQMATAPNTPSFLMAISGRPILGPQDSALWPDPKRLAWHRRHFELT